MPAIDELEPAWLDELRTTELELGATELDEGAIELELRGTELGATELDGRTMELDEGITELELRGAELGATDELGSSELELRGTELGATELDGSGATLLWLLFDDEPPVSPIQADRLAASRLMVTILFIVVPHVELLATSK